LPLLNPVIKLTELAEHSLIPSFFLPLHSYTLHTLRLTSSTAYHYVLWSPVLMSRLCCILVSLLVSYLTNVGKLNRASHCIASNSEYLEVYSVNCYDVVSQVEHKLTSFTFRTLYLFLSWITH